MSDHKIPGQITPAVVPQALIIGAAIADIPVCPVSPQVFRSGSFAVDRITMTTGGDAFNEAIILTRLGHPVRLVTKIGEDGAGSFILDACRREGIDASQIRRDKDLDTGINIVLVTEDGERSFLTSRNGSLRSLTLEDAMPAVEALASSPSIRLVCFASIFVFPRLDGARLAQLFAAVKAQGRILCADMTKRKHGESLDDIRQALSYVDYIFPNYEEASLVSGLTEPEAIADAFLDCGVGTVVMKTGRDGCFVKNRSLCLQIPAYRDARCLDTTGAGDNFAAAFLAALLEGFSLPECALYANAAASLCIEEIGATTAVKEPGQVTRRREEMMAAL